MLFPISDDDRQLSGPALVTWVLIALNVGFFAYQVVNPDFTYGWSTVPQEITSGVDLTNDVPLDSAVPGQIPQRMAKAFQLGACARALQQLLEPDLEGRPRPAHLARDFVDPSLDGLPKTEIIPVKGQHLLVSDSVKDPIRELDLAP